jgi:NAD(P)H-quinone oxidoreductase subunit 5
MGRYVQCLPWLVPLVYVAAAFGALHHRQFWRVLTAACGAALALALGNLVLDIAFGMHRPGADSAPVAAVVIVLIAFLGWVIARYSRTNLAREPGERRYVLALLLTFASVAVVVATENLAVLILAWAASSATLHQLLTFYPDRPGARIAARKQFLASRLAELCLLAAAALLYAHWGTLDLAALDRGATASAAPPQSIQLAGALIGAAVLLKSAQLPLHSWLVEVMEAPTSVSALLHAGVVNLGAYVLIRLAPLISASPAARILLVAVGGATAVLAGLTMMTCSSIKVRLAWSTCSQMGLMAVECGLGLYDLALLHLLAHALYKAHAFLSSGEAVRTSTARRLAPAARTGAGTIGRSAPLLAAPVAVLLLGASAFLWHAALHIEPLSWVGGLICALGIATLFWTGGHTLGTYLRNICLALLGVQLYLAWHVAIARGLGVTAVSGTPLLCACAAVCFLALYLMQWSVLRPARPAWVDRLLTWAAAGYFLDQPLTRLVTGPWPPRAAPLAFTRTASRLAQREGGAA